MTVKTSHLGTGAFLKSEGAGHISRETIAISAGTGVVLAGTVLGRRTAADSAVATAASGNTGNGTMGTITVGAGALTGTYNLVITSAAANAGAFTLTDPLGATVGTGAVGTAFVGGGLSFTLADGSTDFDVDDAFAIAVVADQGEYVPYDPSGANDGRRTAAAVLLADVDATNADRQGVGIVRLAEVWTDRLVWGAGVTTETEKTNGLADLAAKLVIAR